jgi:hypothetical protein
MCAGHYPQRVSSLGRIDFIHAFLLIQAAAVCPGDKTALRSLPF